MCSYNFIIMFKVFGIVGDLTSLVDGSKIPAVNLVCVPLPKSPNPCLSDGLISDLCDEIPKHLRRRG
jgi:hypothetical protein